MGLSVILICGVLCNCMAAQLLLHPGVVVFGGSTVHLELPNVLGEQDHVVLRHFLVLPGLGGFLLGLGGFFSSFLHDFLGDLRIFLYAVDLPVHTGQGLQSLGQGSPFLLLLLYSLNQPFL